MSLEEKIRAKRSEIVTDGHPMSLGEIINLYLDGEIDVHPEFQRIYRWSEEQKTNLLSGA